MKTTNSAKYRLNFFKNEVEDFQFKRTLSYHIYNTASPGEVISAANLLKERETQDETGLIYEMNLQSQMKS